MTKTIVPKAEQIDDVLNICVEAEESGHTSYPGMSYEQGVQAAIQWMRGDTTDAPLGEE